MAAIYLTEADVRELLDVETAIEVVEGAFRGLAEEKAVNVPRTRARAPGIALHVMSAAAEYLGLCRLESLHDNAHEGTFSRRTVCSRVRRIGRADRGRLPRPIAHGCRERSRHRIHGPPRREDRGPLRHRQTGPHATQGDDRRPPHRAGRGLFPRRRTPAPIRPRDERILRHPGRPCPFAGRGGRGEGHRHLRHHQRGPPVRGAGARAGHAPQRRRLELPRPRRRSTSKRSAGPTPSSATPSRPVGARRAISSRRSRRASPTGP